MTAYLLDSNVFIQAKNLHYGFDFVPAFWDWLIRENEAGNVASIERVLDELRAGGDSLSEWAEQRGAAFFLAPDADVAASLGLVSESGSSQNYEASVCGLGRHAAPRLTFSTCSRWRGGISLPSSNGTQSVSERRALLQDRQATTTFELPVDPPSDFGIRCSRVARFGRLPPVR